MIVFVIVSCGEAIDLDRDSIPAPLTCANEPPPERGRGDLFHPLVRYQRWKSQFIVLPEADHLVRSQGHRVVPLSPRRSPAPGIAGPSRL